MAINKKLSSAKEKTGEKVNHDIEVFKVMEMKDRDGCYRFNMRVNTVTIYGMQYITYTTRDGDTANFISFPQYYSKAQDKYYNHCWTELSDLDKRVIEQGIEALLNE